MRNVNINNTDAGDEGNPITSYQTQLAIKEAKEKRMIEIIQEISNQLQIQNLSQETVQAMVDLLRLGIHPDAIVAVILQTK